MKIFFIFLAFILASESNAAIFGVGVSTTDQLLKLETAAQLEEEFKRSEGIVKFFLEYQNKKKENFAKQKNKRTETISKAQELSKKITVVSKEIDDLKVLEQELSTQTDALKALEEKIADSEDSKNKLKLASSVSTVAGYISRGAKAISNISMLTKRFIGYGSEMNQQIGNELSENLKKAEEEIKALYIQHEQILDAINLLKSGPLSKLKKLREKFQSMSNELQNLDSKVQAFYASFQEVLKSYVKPLGNESERIVQNLNALISREHCPQISDLTDLNHQKIASCKAESWNLLQSKVSKKLQKISKCKNISAESSSIEIEACRRAYVKKHK